MPTLTRPGATLYYADDDFSDPWRPNTPVLLQHGFGRNGSFWRGWVPHLSRRNRVIRPDIRGCGGSVLHGGAQPFTRDALLGDLIAILNAVGVETVHFVGESVGGMLGIALAAQNPGYVRTLTLISTPFTAGGSSSPGQTVGHASWQAALTTLGTREWWVRSRAAAGERAADPHAEAYFADEFGRTSAEAAVKLADFLSEEDVSALARSVTVPTLILAPKQAGNRSSPEQQRAMAATMPGADRQEYDGGRGAFYQSPDPLADVVATWIRSREEDA